MKYETNTKTERNKALIKYALAHPELSLKEVGQEFNICAERVRQILKRSK
jgi:DNA-directed RNA polymerase sigma subunit (sigma70/sigma32)